MRKLILSGWDVGFNKVGLTKLLQSDFGYSLSHAKSITDAVLKGQSVTIDLEEDQVEELVLNLKELHAKFLMNKET